MLKNHLRIAFRNVLKHPVYAFLNVGGLALGIAAAFVLLLYTRQELSYDRHFEDHERIYRVATDFYNMGGFAKSQNQLLDFLPQVSPEVELTTRFDRGFHATNVIVEERTYEESRYFFVDTTYFRMFSYRFLAGDPKMALQAPDEAVLSDRLAEKYFGSAPAAMGQTILIGKEKEPFTIAGVVETPRTRTHMVSDLWLPLELEESQSYWTNMQYYNYVKLRPGATAGDLERAMDVLVRDYAYPASQSADPFETWVAGDHAVKFWVQPLTDIYLHSDFQFEIGPGGNPTQVYSLGIIGLFILLIAGVNYINLTTARSSIRAREVGVKKTLGVDRKALVQQFLTETVLFSLMAMVIAAALADVMLKVFSYITGTTMMDSLFASPWDIAALAGFSLVVGVLAGLYPAFYLSSFRPVKILKGDWTVSGNRRLRSSLVVLQFAIATGLGISSFVIYNQLSFLQKTDKGFDQEGVLLIENIEILGSQAEAFRNRIDQQPQVVRSSFARRTPTGSGITMFTYQTPEMEESMAMQTFRGDADFIPTLGMRLLAGRNFSADIASDSSAAILNEAAVRALELGDDPLGKEISEDFRVIGVVSDFHFQSLREKIEPAVVLYVPTGRQLLLKLNSRGVGDFMSRLPGIWREFAPEDPIRYSFVDDNFAQLADQERMLSRAISFFTLLAVLIACMGLFGLSSFAIQRRTKEIGIRKVFGATVAGLVVLLSKDIAKLVLIAFAAGGPIAFFLMSRWLDDFAYRIDLSASPFILGGFAALAIAILTVSFQAIRAAVANPIRSLRYE